ncbi:hypothetical protein Tcan_14649 [Toxocara canis]|uniref:Uncharacterized protein n=1 Tax=Toxocara canis TaxID=6265 RepID=A0A0B2V465_TOXCA|nr:hypothetical protein Tcan_14649 [Toxocara canis]
MRVEIFAFAESTNSQRVSIPFATIKDGVANHEPDQTVSQCDAFSNYSISPTSQREISRVGSVSSRLSFRCERSVSSSDESNVFGMSSSPRVGEAFLKGFPALCREGQPPRTSSLPFLALLTASASSVIFRSQPKALYKVPEHESIDQSHTPTGAVPLLSNETAAAYSSDSPSDASRNEGARIDTLAPELQDGAEVETIRASTVSTVVASTMGHSSFYRKNDCPQGQSADCCTSSDDEGQTPFAADISSDDSFVKVPFGSWHEGDGSDLGDFVHLFRLASQTNIAFSVDQPELIHDQLARFESQQSTFDRFLASLMHPEERESSTASYYYSLKPTFF